MRIVVCVKEVLDPDAVNALVLTGQLSIGPDGKTIEEGAITRVINGYDEQAIEAALRLRDAGVDCQIIAVSVGEDPINVLRYALALGADEIVSIPARDLDCLGVARVIAEYIRSSGGADLVLCGRQASDDDQGIVGPALAELLGIPVALSARALSIEPDGAGDGPALHVTVVTPYGEEVWELPLPAVVTITSELGQPRYPPAARAIKARRAMPQVVTPEELGLGPGDLEPRVVLERLRVVQVEGHCQMISGDGADDTAAKLLEVLQRDGLVKL